MNNVKHETDFYIFKSNNISVNIATMLLLAIVMSIVPILLSGSTSILFQTSLSFYVTVVVMFGLMIYYGYWGILLCFLSFWICGWVLELSLTQLVFNSIINTMQLMLIYLVFIWIKRKSIRNNNIYTEGLFYLSSYNLLLIIIVFLYFILSVFYPSNLIYTLCVLSSILAFMTIVKSIINKDMTLVLFAMFIAITPSLICSYLSSIVEKTPVEKTFEYIAQWTLSNFILLQTIGYFIFQIMFTKSSYKTHIYNDKIINVNVNSLIYYTGQFIWNIIVIYVFITNKDICDSYIFFLPWALGNVLFGLNLYFSGKQELIAKDEKFKWFENRVIVVEQNTQVIITIIALLLPISSALLKNLPTQLLFLFAANIFCACLSVGLIWVPSNQIKFISLLQALKTVFFLFSISLLLLTALLVIFLSE